MIDKSASNLQSKSYLWMKNNKFMFKYILGLAIAFISFQTFSHEIKYKLKMERPQSHYYEVEMELTDFTEKELSVKMPIWSPGSYLAREFAKNVDLVKAFDENGKAIDVKKVSKNEWKVSKGDANKVTVKYEVYAFELTVRTSFLDLTHGFVSGSSVFMYVGGYKDLAGSIDIYKYSEFKVITTALKKAPDGVTGDAIEAYVFDNYDELVDCPIEIGNQIEFSFDAAGVNHTVGIYGVGNFDIIALKEDMAKIVTSATNVFGQNPNKDYTFIIHNVVHGQGGLEHTNSTTLSVNRWTYEGSDYIGFLSLVAHEYFHLWNVKRIRPVELGPFDYDKENYTSLLWVMEGFTSYYDELLLLRSGYYTKEKYLSKLFGTLNYVEGSTGARVQPVAHASFDAWIKAYRPNENSHNTTMSYYSRGQIIAAMLDAKIITKYKGKKCLDHFMQRIYKVYFVEKNRGFSEEEFKQELEDFLGENLDRFYADYINGTEIPDYNSVFESVGVLVEYVGKPMPSTGVSMSMSNGKTTVSRIRRGSAAEDAGLSVNDEIIACNGMRVNKKSMEDIFASLKVGDRANILISRDLQLYSIEIIITAYEKPRFKHRLKRDDQKTLKLNNYWLRTE